MFKTHIKRRKYPQGNGYKIGNGREGKIGQRNKYGKEKRL